MGIDFGNLIKTLGAKAASVSGKADKIDSKQELKEYVSGWDKIKADAKANAEKSGITDLQAQAQTQAEIDALAKAELNEIMGLDFAKNDLNIQKKVDVQKGAVFSDEDISLENLMSLLDDEVAEYDKDGNVVFDDKGNVMKSHVNYNSLKKNMDLSEMTHAGIPLPLAKELSNNPDINTHSLAKNMTSPKFDYPNSTKENCELYGDYAHIANFMDYARAEGYLS